MQRWSSFNINKNPQTDQSHNNFLYRGGWKFVPMGCDKKEWKTQSCEQNDNFRHETAPLRRFLPFRWSILCALALRVCFRVDSQQQPHHNLAQSLKLTELQSSLFADISWLWQLCWITSTPKIISRRGISIQTAVKVEQINLQKSVNLSVAFGVVSFSRQTSWRVGGLTAVFPPVCLQSIFFVLFPSLCSLTSSYIITVWEFYCSFTWLFASLSELCELDLIIWSLFTYFSVNWMMLRQSTPVLWLKL